MLPSSSSSFASDPGIEGITIKQLDEESIENSTVYTVYMASDLKNSVFSNIAKNPKTVDCTDSRTISLRSHIVKVKETQSVWRMMFLSQLDKFC